MIKIDWLFARQGYSKNGNDFLQVLNKLDEAQNETLNATTLVDALLNPVKKLQQRVLLWIFLPFVL